ncbi:MAG: class I SAM-dependent methyltransferase [Bryobacteraceae bacterium]
MPKSVDMCQQSRITGYCSRWDFLLKRCTNKTILHLGCIGETDCAPEEKLEAFCSGRALHPNLVRVASDVTGVDLNAEAVHLIQTKAGLNDLLVGDVEHLEAINLQRTFQLIIFGDLIEHLSSPGLALDGIRQFMSPDSELIISTPNAFSLPANIRYSLGRHREGAEHVAAYSKFTLPAVLARHGFSVTELLTCFDRPPQSWTRRLTFAIGTPVFRMLPERGGTLLAVAKRTI